MSKRFTLLLTGLLCSLSVNAQQQVTDSLQLNTITVTASKIPQSQRETTKPVLLIDQKTIEQSAGKDLAQLLNEQSGIIINNANSAPGSTKGVYIQGATTKYALVLIDGIPVSDPSGVGGALDFRMLPLNYVERIEVVKGSHSTLYGSNAVAGVINIITKKSTDNPFSATASASYGSYDTFEGDVGVNGQVGDITSYVINFTRETTSGLSAAQDQSGSGNFDKDGFNQNTLFAKVGVNPFENLNISPYINYSSNEGDFDADAFTDGANSFDLTLINPGVRVDYATGDLKLNAGYNFTSMESRNVTFFGESTYEGSIHNLDVFSTYHMSDHILALVGTAYENSILPDNTSSGEKEEAQLFSPYATVYLRDYYGLNVELGYRLNSHSEYGTNSTFSIAPSYNITEQVKVMASVGTGFKVPTLSELYGPFGANADLDPEKSITFDVGAIAYLSDNQLKLEAHYFNRTVDDIIIYDFSSGYINRDKQDDHGVELEASWLINEFVTAGAFYNYLYGEITETDFSGNETSSYNLIRRPKHSVGTKLNVTPIRDLSVSLNGTWMGERTDLFYDPVTFAASEVELDPYLLVDLYAEYKLSDGMFTFFADLKNILNASYYEVYGYNTMGLNLKSGLRLNF